MDPYRSTVSWALPIRIKYLSHVSSTVILVSPHKNGLNFGPSSVVQSSQNRRQNVMLGDAPFWAKKTPCKKEHPKRDLRV
jgi:hypothetical protein